MNEIEKGLPKLIFILIDEKGAVQYCNIKSTRIVKELLGKFSITESLDTNDFIQNEIGDYIITAEKLSIEGKLLWAVTIEREDFPIIYKDFSTGLYNRNYWEHIKSGIIKLSGAMSYSIIVIDIDNLKERNDMYGHIEGDKAIEIVGAAIQESIRENDIPIHYGGDEFLIILPNTNSKGAEKAIERVRNEIAKKCGDEKIKIEISAGIACSDCVSDLQAMVQAADKKMYYEKRRKKS